MRLIFAFLVLSALTIFGRPAQIILLRHAEKPDDPAAVNLSPKGRERARALVSLLGKSSPLTSHAPIAALYATDVTKKDHSHRNGETLAPLAKELGLPVQTPYKTEAYSALARKILANTAYRGKTVVICWTHHNIADLATALGVQPKPSQWNDTTFDRLWMIKPGVSGASFRDLPQELLNGDSKH